MKLEELLIKAKREIPFRRKSWTHADSLRLSGEANDYGGGTIVWHSSGETASIFYLNDFLADDWEILTKPEREGVEMKDQIVMTVEEIARLRSLVKARHGDRISFHAPDIERLLDEVERLRNETYMAVHGAETILQREINALTVERDRLQSQLSDSDFLLDQIRAERDSALKEVAALIRAERDSALKEVAALKAYINQWRDSQTDRSLPKKVEEIMKLNERDLSSITEIALRHFKEDRMPVLITESQFRAMCFAKATLSVLVSKGMTEVQVVEFPVERVTMSVFED